MTKSAVFTNANGDVNPSSNLQNALWDLLKLLSILIISCTIIFNTYLAGESVGCGLILEDGVVTAFASADDIG